LESGSFFFFGTGGFFAAMGTLLMQRFGILFFMHLSPYSWIFTKDYTVINNK
jgi:hypothetical protein